jgi:hypothetical protein
VYLDCNMYTDLGRILWDISCVLYSRKYDKCVILLNSESYKYVYFRQDCCTLYNIHLVSP